MTKKPEKFRTYGVRPFDPDNMALPFPIVLELHRSLTEALLSVGEARALARELYTLAAQAEAAGSHYTDPLD